MKLMDRTKKAKAFTTDGHQLRVGDVVRMKEHDCWVRVEGIGTDPDGAPKLLVQGVDVYLRPSVVGEVGEPFEIKIPPAH
jgi:hypothetical protein